MKTRVEFTGRLTIGSEYEEGFEDRETAWHTRMGKMLLA